MKFDAKILKLIANEIDEFAKPQTLLWKKIYDHYAKMVDPVIKEFNEGLADDILNRVKSICLNFILIEWFKMGRVWEFCLPIPLVKQALSSH